MVVCFWFISGAIPPKFEYNKDLEKWLTTAVLDKDEGLLLLILLVALFLGTSNETMDSFWISENEFLGSRLEPSLACSRLSDSGEDAKVKGKRKVGGARKRKKEKGRDTRPSSLQFPAVFFLSFFHFRAFSIQRTRLSRNLEQASSSPEFVGRDEKRAPLKTPAWESKLHRVKKCRYMSCTDN